jgi:hypothetical protein
VNSTTIIELSAISGMDSAPPKVMVEAYHKVWVNNTYTNMKMLKEILEANECSIGEFLRRAMIDKTGKKLRQMGIKKIPDSPNYHSTGGLCTAFTLKVIAESRRSFNEFTIGTNKFHRLAWDSNNILICSSKGMIMVMEPSNFGDEGFTDPTVKMVRKL